MDIRGLVQSKTPDTVIKRLWNNFLDIDNVFLKNLHRIYSDSKRIGKFAVSFLVPKIVNENALRAVQEQLTSDNFLHIMLTI